MCEHRHAVPSVWHVFYAMFGEESTHSMHVDLFLNANLSGAAFSGIGKWMYACFVFSSK